MEKTIQVEKIPQLTLFNGVKDQAIKKQFAELIEFTNKLMRDNVALKFRTVNLTEWIVQLEKKMIQPEVIKNHNHDMWGK